MQNTGKSRRAFVQFSRLFLIFLSALLAACLSDKNHPPTASAGPNIIAVLGDRISLNAESSSDVDGDTLTYTWELIDRPQFSQATLSDPNAITPAIEIDQDGIYQLKLIVSDGKSFSTADFITITTTNDLPVAKMSDVTPNATGDYQVGDVIVLDATDSYDPEQRDLIYHWELILQPDNSLASLENNDTPNTQFLADLPGAYIVHLIVDDGTNQSIPATVIFNVRAVKDKTPGSPNRTTQSKPIAEAGLDQPLYEPVTLIQLDGTASSDAEGDLLSYEWEIIAKPNGSRVQLSDPTSDRPIITTDILGSYVIQLIVDDGVDGKSLADTVVLTPHDNKNGDNNKNSKLPCEDCHNDEITTGKFEDHILTYDDCASCHSINTFKPSIGSFHPHGYEARPFVCQVCHNGLDAKGKSENHIITDLECNTCHLISETTWLPAKSEPAKPKFNHKGIFSGCKSCHDGVSQTGKPLGHIPSSSRCNACHADNAWLPAKYLEHTAALGLCNNCHDDGKEKKIKPPNHINTTEMCLGCHHAKAWLPVVIDHNQTFGICSDCHDGEIAVGKSAIHIPAPDFCDLCHNVLSWTQTLFRHTDISSPCVACHNGIQASGKLETHISSTDDCRACHGIKSFVVKNVDHLNVLGTCIACHDKLTASGKIANHLNTSDACEACHSVASFFPPLAVDHNEVIGKCVECHNGFLTKARKDPLTHLRSTNECDGCHETSKWTPVGTINHPYIEEKICTICHVQFREHIPTIEKCDVCHNTDSFIPTVQINHDAVIGECIDCHNNIVALGISELHLNTNDECQYCHDSNVPWRLVLKINHSSVIGQCLDCHASIDRHNHDVGEKSAPFCGSCHSTQTWVKVFPILHGESTEACASCHNGIDATGKKVDHINVTVNCVACHSFQQWSPVLIVDHLEVRDHCDHCHTGNIAIKKPINHLATRNNCQACHDTSQFSPVAKLDHISITGDCALCHFEGDATRKMPNHIRTTNNCELCHNSIFWIPVNKIDHSQLLSDCAICHEKKNSAGQQHIPSDDLCQNCHGTNSFSPALSYTHYFIDIKQPCTNCHNNQPASHISLGVNENCENCHVTSAWLSTYQPLFAVSF